jgi:regulatory protein
MRGRRGRGTSSSAPRPPAADLPPPERAREICLAALERRRRTRFELERTLARKGVPAEVAAPVLDRLAEVGLIDDLAYARVYVAERQKSRPRGPRGLASELAAKGIAASIIDRVLAESRETEDPVASARRAVASKLRALRHLPPAEARRKAEQFLLRRGFGYETIREALSAEGAAGGDEDPGLG